MQQDATFASMSGVRGSSGRSTTAGNGRSDQRLVSLAKARFGKDLRRAERKVAINAARGDITDFGHDDPVHGAAWPRERSLRASFLRWLLASEEARKHIDFRGVNIIGARVEGTLELRGAETDTRFGLHMCALDRVWLEDAQVRTVSLAGCRCAGMDANRLRVRGGLYMHMVENRRFDASGSIDLTGATIEGELNCSGARIVMTEDAESNGGALTLEGAKVDGRVVLAKGFGAKGTVVLRSARIGGSLECSGGEFFSQGGVALDADAMDVAHSVLLDRRFKAEGSVQLTDTVIGHNLKCSGGRFFPRGEVAVNASRLKIAGTATLGGTGGAIDGKVVLSEATIGGSLELKNIAAAPGLEVERAHIGTDLAVEHVEFGGVGTGLVATDAKIDGKLTWSNVTPVSGAQLDLRGVEVGTLADGLSNRPESVEGFTPRYKGLTYRRIEPTPAEKEEVCQRIRWLERDEEYSPQPYNQLAAALRASGHDDRAVSVAIAREDRRRASGGLNWRGRVWSKVLKVLIGSGYRPQWALLWSLTFIAAGCVIFGLAEKSDHLVQTTARETPFSFVLYSFDTFLPVTDLQQERFRAPGGAGIRSILVHAYFFLHVLAGWVLVTLGILGVTGLVRKD